MTPTRASERRVCTRTDPRFPATPDRVVNAVRLSETTTPTHQTAPHAAARRPNGASWVASRTTKRGMAEARHGHPSIHRNHTHSRRTPHYTSSGVSLTPYDDIKCCGAHRASPPSGKAASRPRRGGGWSSNSRTLEPQVYYDKRREITSKRKGGAKPGVTVQISMAHHTERTMAIFARWQQQLPYAR